MTTKDLVKQTLAKWKFPVLKEVENAIIIRYQMNYVQIGSLQDDRHAIAVTLSRIFTAEDEREVRLALKACNDLNYQMMQVKLYLDEDNELVIASEFFFNNEEDVEFLLNIALQALITAKKRFIQQYEAVVDEDNLLRELNSD